MQILQTLDGTDRPRQHMARKAVSPESGYDQPARRMSKGIMPAVLLSGIRYPTKYRMPVQG